MAIRESTALLLAGMIGAAALTGCARNKKAPAATQPIPPAPVVEQPPRPVEPPAMAGRGWPVSAATYPGLSVPTYPTYWGDFDRVAARSDLQNTWLAPLEFLGNVVLLPFRMVMQRPDTVVMSNPMLVPARQSDQGAGPTGQNSR